VETVIELLANAAARHDRRPALLIKPAFRTRRWRYSDLAQLAPRVARVLADAGLSPGDRAVIWAVNLPEWGIAFLGALHAGATLVPLDFRTQEDFAAKVAARTDARLVLASVQTAPQATALGLPVVLIEQLPDMARNAEPLPTPPVRGDDLVEIVFTSGTTGDPKGAMLTHRNLVSNAESLLQVFTLGPGERLLSVLPLSHLFEQTCGFLTPLLAGASVAYPVSRQPSVLLRTFRDFRATMLLIVPQGLKLLDNAIERRVDATGKRATFERLHSWARKLPRPLQRLLFRPVLRQFGGRLRTIAVGGAAMDTELARRWTEMGLDVLQGYGATEMAPVISFTRPDRNRHGTVGEAIPGVEIRVAPDGEVLARGPNRFVGYWQDPDATAAAIDPEGWYHTGDLGELSAEGFLTLRGRKKDMLAMPDGTKVYPEDIEGVLTKDPRVRDAAVVGMGTDADLRIHAALLLHSDGAEEVVRDANRRLGAHQQIRSHSIWPADDFPRTHTLKVKKRLVIERLEADAVAPTESGRATSAADRGPKEKVAAAPDSLEGFIDLVAGVADLPPASVTPESRLSSDLNMDSLARIEVLGVIEEELGAFIDDSTIDPEVTVAELHALAMGARDAKRETGIFGWPLNPLVRAVGLGIQELLVLPIVGLFYRVRVRGEHHLAGLEGPVIFLPNHHLHTDNAIILTHLPLVWRWRLSIAAAADDIFGNPIQGLGAAVIGNAFPLAREGAVRRSFELLGARLDRNFSILIFPEGKLTVGGPMQPFKAGAGLVAVEGATPVVPMKLKINRLSWIDGRRRGSSLRGDVEVVFGAPIWFPAGTDASAATASLEEAVAAL
jgi:long-chain acyl-CoA synthetase